MTGKLSFIALLSLYAALAASLLRYGGLQHDAQVYVAQALLRLGGTPLEDDLFFRYGSQDEFTLFPSFAAIFISAFGLDHGAAILTAGFLVFFFVAVWFLTRALADVHYAWAAVGLLIVVPAWYGSAEVFQVVERFLTARLPAVGMCLLAFSALVSRRYWWSASLLGLAFITHPLMALPAVAIAVTCLTVDQHRFLRQPLLSVITLLAILFIGILLGGTSPLMDPDWLSDVRRRSEFLFLDTWHLVDWKNVVLPLITLSVAASIREPGLPRRLIASSVSVAIVGLAATSITTWGPPVSWVIKTQPWRWMWPATVLAIALLPWVLISLHRQHGSSCRIGATLLACAWIVGSADRSNETAVATSIALSLASGLVVALRSRLPVAVSHIWRPATMLIAAAAVSWILGMAASELSFGLDLGGDPHWVQQVVALLRIPALAGLCVAALAMTISRHRSSVASSATVVVCLSLLFGAYSEAARSWTREQFGSEVLAKFAVWRQVIGKHDEVFWPDNLQATWFGLGRRSYLSVSQLGGIVFSAETTSEARRRATALAGVFPAQLWFGQSGRQDRGSWATSELSIRTVCAVPEIGYVVTRTDLGSRTPAIEWPTAGHVAYLYDCRQLVPSTE